MAQHRHDSLVIPPFFALNQDLETGSAGLDVVENIEKWLGYYLGLGVGGGSELPT